MEQSIANLGYGHLVSQEIMKEYIKKPTLVYITFWGPDTAPACQPKIKPKLQYGNYQRRFSPDTGVTCIVENPETAFSPFLADKYTMQLYRRLRTPDDESILPNIANLNIYPRYETLDGVTKPSDYHFLENFHRMNILCSTQIHKMIGCGEPGAQQYHSRRRVRWPNIVVRLQELWNCMGHWKLTVNSSSDKKLLAYKDFFGVLSSCCGLAELQDYFILIDRKQLSEHTRNDEEYRRNSERSIPCHGHTKSYDVLGKTVSDLTFASAEDFDWEQRIWAGQIERVFGAWETIFTVKLPNAYFVRWKNEKELEEERQTNAQFSCGRAGLGGRYRAPKRKYELLHQSPVNYYFSSPLGSRTRS
ncbi:hypothetical protein F5Y07DRAFT_402885 [Xylaria sp. FL0933]|nr:hypothetical protein F5Y07DRAFT_402885 [Xylaria sp. FL0933]